MNRDSCQKPLMLRMHSFVFSFICVDKQGRVHEEYYEEYYALIQYANHISHYFPLKKTVACYALTHTLSLNLLSSIRAVDAFHSRHDCNTTVINRFCRGIISSFEVSY